MGRDKSAFGQIASIDWESTGAEKRPTMFGVIMGSSSSKQPASLSINPVHYVSINSIKDLKYLKM